MKPFFPPTIALCIAVPMHAFAQSEDPSSKVNIEEPRLEEVRVLGSRKAYYTEITENTQKLVEMPGALGDPLGAISALPGVITPSGGGAPAVRGSSPSDNRYYIDGIPAGYIFHEFNTSIFDENVVQDFQLFSAGFGAQYSNATGAVFDVRLRDPRNQDITTTVSASLLRAGVFVEGGVTENSAFYLSAREGLIQYFLPEDDEADEDGVRIIDAPADGDYQFKYLWDVNENNQLTFNLTGATDAAEVELTEASEAAAQNPDFGGRAELDKSFDSQGISWISKQDSGAEMRLTFAHFEDVSNVEWGQDYFLDLKFDNTLAKGYYSFPLTDAHTITVGGEVNDYSFDYSARFVNFVCTEFDADCQDGRGDIIEDARILDVQDSTLYVVDNWQVTDDINIEAGFQNYNNDYTDESFITPRIAMSWRLNQALTLTSSAGRYNRFPDIETVLPLIGNPDLKSPEATHFTVGMKGDIGSDWNWSVESYVKTLESLPLALNEDQDDAEQLYSNDVEGDVVGVDLMLNRNLNNGWYGWASLSISESTRTNLRTDETRNYTLDTPVVLNVVGNYQLTDKWTTGFRFTAKSGEATTEIVGVKENPDFPGHYLPVYADAYDDRLPIYARLDLRAEREIELWGKSGSFYIDVINALNTRNTVAEHLDYEMVTETGELHIEKVEDMEIFPSVGISLTF